jgi:hypothetical protein
MPTFADDSVLLHNNTTNQWIWRSCSKAALRQFKTATHPQIVKPFIDHPSKIESA